MRGVTEERKRIITHVCFINCVSLVLPARHKGLWKSFPIVLTAHGTITTGTPSKYASKRLLVEVSEATYLYDCYTHAITNNSILRKFVYSKNIIINLLLDSDGIQCEILFCITSCSSIAYIYPFPLFLTHTCSLCAHKPVKHGVIGLHSGMRLIKLVN